jgi:hypothetical protein
MRPATSAPPATTSTASTPDMVQALEPKVKALGARVDTGVSTSRKRVWKGHVVVEQDVYALVGVTGAHVRGTVRAKAGNADFYWGGGIDNVVVHDRALDPSEIW